MSKEATAGSWLGLTDFTDASNRAVTWRAFLAEFAGTALLVFIGLASCLGANSTHLGIAVSFGVAVATVVAFTAHVSGGHVNPAVTASMLVTGQIGLVKAMCYVAAQCVGAIVGASIVHAIDPVKDGLGLTQPGSGVTSGNAVAVELLVTFILVMTVHAVCDSNREDHSRINAPAAIGLAVLCCHIGFIQFTGCSMNSARALGPAVILNDFNEHWVYWVGPIAGGVLAGLIYKYIFKVGKNGVGSYDF
ncbi:aquaporin AQPAe.a isoform X3 [Ctenocephalides felis]|uniref:aquaporin AQPAe.a isoform X2 n=1 Tax=Ctenocephalides felis TaxID=7515 RepID=UPI000E6E289E|nr:aquaporin AQPAe.a isoform X2 [Ctenocephalides felis]XP_026461703.1 aquaporin AQPAe.a isoform X3 [Ctenocephalides felis]